MNILVTGGAGYIGSHTLLSLYASGYNNVVVVDNLCNSKATSLERVKEITGKETVLVNGDIRDENLMLKIMQAHNIDAVIHFAGLKAVGESVAKPLSYYSNNVYGTLVLLEVMQELNIKNFIFSSSATVYGDPETLPITESNPTGGTTNPYGRSKYQIEEMLKDLCISDPEFKAISLRYFNPVGAHESGNMGEDPNGIPNNLMPFITQVAIGRRPELSVFGDDYDTPDGTGVRDYIHVVDLADGHVAAIKKLGDIDAGFTPINLGTGNGYSVLEMVKAFSDVCGNQLPYKICPRREGDIAACYANPEKAKTVLDWEARFGLDKMCQDAWRWQSQNPEGYPE